MPFPWIDKQDLEDRIGSTLVRRIYDDNKDGVADTNPVEAILRESCSFVAGALGPHYTVETLSTMTAVPMEIIRITKDVAEAYAAKRHPRIVNREWQPLINEARLDLKQIRQGFANLGTSGSPEPSKLTQGTAYVEGQSEPANYPDSFGKNGFGIF